MKKTKLILLSGVTAAIVLIGAWVPFAAEVDNTATVIASGELQESSIPTILPPL